jgi:hypothetical protein
MHSLFVSVDVSKPFNEAWRSVRVDGSWRQFYKTELIPVLPRQFGDEFVDEFDQNGHVDKTIFDDQLRSLEADVRDLHAVK